jgi:hypothetical protein
MSLRSRKIKYFWKMATEHIEFDEDEKKMKEHQKVKIDNKPKEEPWVYSYNKISRINDFDKIYMDGKIAEKRDLVSPFGISASGKGFYKLRDSDDEFTEKLHYFKYSPKKYSKDILCSILDKSKINDKTCEEYYKMYLNIINQQDNLSNKEALIKMSNGKISDREAKYIDKYVHIVDEVVEDKNKILKDINKEDINEDAPILPFYKDITYLKKDSLNSLFSKECDGSTDKSCINYAAIMGLKSTKGLALEERTILRAEKEIKIIKLVPICKRDDGVNVYYDLIGKGIIEDKNKRYGVINNKKTLYINSQFKKFVEHHKIEDVDPETRNFINDIKWEVCRVKPTAKLKLGPPSRPKFEPLCDMPMFKNTPYCKNIKEIKEFCKANPDAPICASPHSIMSEIKSGWDWMCNLEPFKSQAICGAKKKKEITKKDDFDLPDSVHTWKEPSGMSFCDKNPNHPNCKG